MQPGRLPAGRLPWEGQKLPIGERLVVVGWGMSCWWESDCGIWVKYADKESRHLMDRGARQRRRPSGIAGMVQKQEAVGMSEAELMEILRSSINELLRWVGFGTLTGLAAKAIMPGRDPGGALTTMLMGIAGSVIGCGTALFFFRDASIDPISMRGFFAAVFGAFTLLFFYRLMSGSFFKESSESEDRWVHRVRRRLRRRRIVSDIVRDSY